MSPRTTNTISHPSVIKRPIAEPVVVIACGLILLVKLKPPNSSFWTLSHHFWPSLQGASRFGCNKMLKCCSNSKCTTLKVIDDVCFSLSSTCTFQRFSFDHWTPFTSTQGPNCRIEQMANMPIIDASLSTCQYFTGSKSCGYTDKILITCTVVSNEDQIITGEPGPCALTSEDAKAEGIPLCPHW